MGVDWTAHAVIGCRLERGAVYHKVRYRGCEHYEEPGAVFCPVCGKKMWEERLEMRPEFDAVDERKAPGLLLVRATDEKHFVLAAVSAMSNGSRQANDPGFASLDATSVEQMRHACREFLRPLGLWDESRFGLWAVLHCSY